MPCIGAVGDGERGGDLSEGTGVLGKIALGMKRAADLRVGDIVRTDRFPRGARVAELDRQGSRTDAPALKRGLYVIYDNGQSDFMSIDRMVEVISSMGALGRDSQVRYFIETVHADGRQTRDQWLPQWGRPSASRLRELIGRLPHPPRSAKIVTAGGDVVADI